MAKYKWKRFKKPRDTGIQIYHFARRLGKTRKIIEDSFNNTHPYCVILNPHTGMTRNCIDQYKLYLDERGYPYVFNPHEHILEFMDQYGIQKHVRFGNFMEVANNMMQFGAYTPYEGRFSLWTTAHYYIDNLDYVTTRSDFDYQFIRNMYEYNMLKSIAFTGIHGDETMLDLVQLIIYRNPSGYHHKAYEPETPIFDILSEPDRSPLPVFV